MTILFLHYFYFMSITFLKFFLQKQNVSNQPISRILSEAIIYLGALLLIRSSGTPPLRSNGNCKSQGTNTKQNAIRQLANQLPKFPPKADQPIADKYRCFVIWKLVIEISSATH